MVDVDVNGTILEARMFADMDEVKKQGCSIYIYYALLAYIMVFDKAPGPWSKQTARQG